jgi:hypothetical protein
MNFMDDHTPSETEISLADATRLWCRKKLEEQKDANGNYLIDGRTIVPTKGQGGQPQFDKIFKGEFKGLENIKQPQLFNGTEHSVFAEIVATIMGSTGGNDWAKHQKILLFFTELKFHYDQEAECFIISDDSKCTLRYKG